MRFGEPLSPGSKVSSEPEYEALKTPVNECRVPQTLAEENQVLGAPLLALFRKGRVLASRRPSRAHPHDAKDEVRIPIWNRLRSPPAFFLTSSFQLR